MIYIGLVAKVLRDLTQAIKNVVTDNDECVTIYSGIWAFGHLWKMPARETGEHILKCLIEALGEDRTIIFPSYTFTNFVRTRVYDALKDKPETGALPLIAMESGDFKRTRNAMDSYLVKGPRSTELLSLSEKTLWGESSVMNWFGQNARTIILGEHWHTACSLFHWIEENQKVPYRYYKRFNGQRVLASGELEACDEVMYVRPWECTVRWNYKAVEPVMRRNGAITDSNIESIPVMSSASCDIFAACLELFENDIFTYIENVNEVKYWIENIKETEIFKLKKEESNAIIF